ncbi:uncharacterized protein LOC115675418 [Syzygium oleosum]|uniref:uncharacterized protein LOC115675418 n=1 Tax=Syzygium oleosum TaxID=219896 RepID=UPI0011D21577|nr:uncharacterized protein LOC115675418 [Syzygium oleosum]
MSADKPPLKPLSPQEWESLIEDFQHGRETWTSAHPAASVADLAVSSLLRRDLPLALKHSLLVFLEEFADALFVPASRAQLLGRLVEALRSVVQSPLDPAFATYALKEQVMVSTASIFVSVVDGLGGEEQCARDLASLVELLLAIVNRPNHGPDRQTRAVACECLRQLERNWPCLLAEIAGHLWSLCQSERTHASQSYILLFAQVIHDIVTRKVDVSILNTSVPLVPFNLPQWVLGPTREVSALNYKELRRAMAFLLEWPQILTPCGMMEFMHMIIPVAVALELQASMLKVQFFSMIYSYDPVLCHMVLMLYLRFLDAFDGQEHKIARRLVSVSREAQGHPVFRMLALHWLLGFFSGMSNRVVERKNMVVDMASSFYPTVFDPLAVKALKLDLLALCSLCLGSQNSEDVSQADSLSVVKLFKDGLVSVSAFKWMPPWSTETAVAFRTLYNFLIGTLSLSVDDSIKAKMLLESTIFRFLQGMIVEMTMEFQQLVPTIVSFVNRFLGCNKHCWLGERLLQTLDERLLPKVSVDYKLVAYFAIFDKIAGNITIPPRGLLELLTNLVIFLVKKHGPDTGLRSWSQGIKVLGICRTMMMHHHSSRLFLRLSRLLASTCLYFPDLEVRDNARIYLRMLVCVPGKKLRELLKLGEQLPTMTPSGESDTFFNVQAPRLPHDPRKSRNISAYVHLERVVPLLVKQSWSLSLANLGFGNAKAESIVGIKDSEPKFDDAVIGITSDEPISSESLNVEQQLEPLRVMDAKISEMLGTLRRHFSSIPDFRHMPGIKVKISCCLRFESDPFSRIWGFSSPSDNPNAADALPAIYATVLKFSSSAPYGSIPLFRIPFLLGEPPKKNDSSVQKVNSDVHAVENGAHEDDSFRASVTIELEPREPTPGMVDVFLETNSANGQIIRGQLHSISVGIEDMFLKAITPSDIPDSSVPLYYSDLFTSLWEACDGSSNFGRETFPLKGGKGVAAISGTRSVKLLEVPASSMIQSTERYLAPFVVKVTGEPLSDLVKDGGVIKDIIWKDSVLDISDDATLASVNFEGPLQLKYTDEEDDRETYANYTSRNMGCIHILIFLPPRYHLLLQMEVSDASTLVRIRTDHWPCLAYIDDYLEALYLA